MASTWSEELLTEYAEFAVAEMSAKAEEARADARFAAWQSRQCQFNMDTGEIRYGIAVENLPPHLVAPSY